METITGIVVICIICAICYVITLYGINKIFMIMKGK